ncbi:VQ motif-containing protein 25-like [Cornus florida]|uniref:VQ motif-containing protein 25-like n=1 Tax=Cornus florida TaxID=4283 RepID=UPI00289AB01B|nr:VQ motif-containing protein 25-like [Cornus florida]
MKPHLCDHTVSSPCKAAMHKDSHIISKLQKPKIRIIHLFAPEIIKTDVQNFRELVQKLTGKPADHGVATRSSSGAAPIKALRTMCPEPSMEFMDVQQDEIQIFHNGDVIKKEETDIWELDENSNNFVDVDGFIQDLTEFPLLPFKSSFMNAY